MVLLDQLQSILNSISGFLWGWPLIILIVGTGILFTLLLRGVQIRGLFHAFKVIRGDYDGPASAGEVSHFKALAVALSATIGIGNIAGVATAIHLGGPGAVFWMWVTAFFGMATKYASCTLSVHFRETNEAGNLIGGPMLTLARGVKGGKFLGAVFAVCTAIAAFGIGNMVQSNTAAVALSDEFGGVAGMWSMILAVFLALVILGGVRRLANVAGTLVPLMCGLYLLGSIYILIVHAGQIPAMFGQIFGAAFSSTAASGGVAGYSVMMALRWGVARGVFSNEAGLGSAPIAHAAARTDEPVREGLVAMTGPLIDTLIVCTATALIILGTGADYGSLTGVVLTKSVFAAELGRTGSLGLSIAVALFAFSTALGWGYYGEQAVLYLASPKWIAPYRVLYVLAFVAAGFVKLELVWTFADVANGFMALPNLYSLIVLAPLLLKLTRDYFSRMEKG